MSVEVIIKAANQRVDDQAVACAPEWTILDLKDHLAHNYPGNPRPDDQKLIYFGQLMPNHLQLKDVLRLKNEDTTHTIHLVCRSDGIHKAASMPVLKSNEEPKSKGIEEAKPEPQQDRPIHHSTTVPVSMSEYPSQARPPSNMNPEQIRQYREMHLDYVRWYMDYYRPWFHSVYPQYGPPPHVPPPPPIDPQPDQQQPEEAPRNQNVRMDAQGGAVMEDDEEGAGRNQDVLDWVYLLARAAALFSIVYFYSNFLRFSMVMILGFLLFNLQALWRANRGLQPRNPTPEPNPPQDESNSGQEHDAEESRNSVPPPSMLGYAWTFVTGLFYSLFPEIPTN